MRYRLAALACTVMIAAAQNTLPYPPRMQGARAEVYKTVGDVKLNAYIFNPPGHKATDKRAAIVFFFGGGWKSGSPAQFERQARYFATRGMVGITADYRVASRHNAKAVDSVRDAKSAVRWIRQHAARLGIDPERIAAGGGSSGGHIAACAGVIEGLDEPGEDPEVSSKPNALVLFNPALVLAPVIDLEEERTFDALKERTGVDPEEISPFHHLKKGTPPTIIFHGKADTTVRYITAELYATKMAAAGDQCELIGFDGAEHGFFNYGRGDGKAYFEALRKAAEFLSKLGYFR